MAHHGAWRAGDWHAGWSTIFRAVQRHQTPSAAVRHDARAPSVHTRAGGDHVFAGFSLTNKVNTSETVHCATQHYIGAILAHVTSTAWYRRQPVNNKRDGWRTARRRGAAPQNRRAQNQTRQTSAAKAGAKAGACFCLLVKAAAAMAPHRSKTPAACCSCTATKPVRS